jgi:glucoamylase
VWDSKPDPQHGLHPGKPTGSAMPLAWAHAEFIKLAHSWAIGRPFDRPEAVWQRYNGQRPKLNFALWSPSAPILSIETGQTLRICLQRPATIHWRTFETDTQRTATTPTGLGLHVTEIDTSRLTANQKLQFIVQYHGESQQNADYTVTTRTKESMEYS